MKVYRKRTPSTNNALESFNNVIKNEDTFRERYPLGRFMELSLTSIKRWSNLYKNKDKIFFEKTEPSLEQWTIAYQWARMNKDISIRETEFEFI